MSDDRSWLDLMAEAQDAVLKSIHEGVCGCHNCITTRGHVAMHMVLCPICRNKRCPHANDHRNACTRSNEPGQPGSAY